MDDDFLDLLIRVEHLEDEVEHLDCDVRRLVERFDGWLKALGLMVVGGVFTALLNLLH